MKDSQANDRKSIKVKVVKTLCSQSGNLCAYPECNQSLTMGKENIFIGEIAHIEPIKASSLRYNPKRKKATIDDIENLIVLCSNHHRYVDRAKEISANCMREWKVKHYDKVCSLPAFVLKEEQIKEIVREHNEYMIYLENNDDLRAEDVAYEEFVHKLDAKISDCDLFNDIIELMSKATNNINTYRSNDILKKSIYEILQNNGVSIEIFENLPYYENPLDFSRGDPENMIMSNNFAASFAQQIGLLQYRFWYYKTKNNPADMNANQKYEEAQKNLKEVNEILLD